MVVRISVETETGEFVHLMVDAHRDTPAYRVAEAINRATGLNLSFAAEAGEGISHASGIDVTWAELAIVDGTVISASGTIKNRPRGAHAGEHSTVGPLLITQTSGPEAGTCYWVTHPGVGTFGSDSRCTWPLSDPDLPITSAAMTVDNDGHCTIENTTEDSVVTLDGVPVTEPVDWEEGHWIRIGNTTFEITTTVPEPASIDLSNKPGLIDFNRPPRLLPHPRETDFKYPAEPEQNARGPLPILAMLIPLMLAITLATVMQRPYFLIFGLMSPVMMVANYINNRKNGKVSYRQRKAKYRATVSAIDQDLNRAIVDYTNEQRFSLPDPATAGLIATMPTPRLWERRRVDPDYLSIRIGVTETTTDISLYRPEELDHRRTQKITAPDVPVPISLVDYGVIGICGDPVRKQQTAAWAVAQLAITQSPRDVSITVLTTPESKDYWE